MQDLLEEFLGESVEEFMKESLHGQKCCLIYICFSIVVSSFDDILGKNA